jgi:hypothetical protein
MTDSQAASEIATVSSARALAIQKTRMGLYGSAGTPPGGQPDAVVEIMTDAFPLRRIRVEDAAMTLFEKSAVTLQLVQLQVTPHAVYLGDTWINEVI